MIGPRFYSAENTKRVRYLQMGIAAGAAIVCTYLVAVGFLEFRQSCGAEKALNTQKQSALKLLRDAGELRKKDAKRPPPRPTKVDTFAVEFSEWARARGIKLESLIPEGAPAPQEIVIDGQKLGTWNQVTIRVKGQGGYDALISLIEKICNPGMPVKLEGFSLRSTSGANGSLVAFDLVLSVFEKKSEAS